MNKSWKYKFDHLVRKIDARNRFRERAINCDMSEK